MCICIFLFIDLISDVLSFPNNHYTALLSLYLSLRLSCPNMSLTLNIIRCREAARDLMTVISASMRLTSLRMFFCDDLYIPGLHHVARYQQDSLECLEILESMLFSHSITVTHLYTTDSITT